jgi:EAL domain-containing protein (putative c-di-GMP-specific phosphodiesterase class I)
MKLKKMNYDAEFFLNFQPQVSLYDYKLTAFEVLLRWRTRSGELISPAEFIPIAEENGSIVQIGEWVIKKALEQMKDWQEASGKEVRLAINVSAKEQGVRDLLSKLTEKVERYGLRYSNIELEITESIQLENNRIQSNFWKK